MCTGATYGPFGSSVSVWPHSVSRTLGKLRGWNAALLRSGWYVECERVLRRRGYRGGWMPGARMRVGDFWRRHKDVPSLLAQIPALHALAAEPWASLAAPSNKRMQLTKRGYLVGSRPRWPRL